MDIQILSRKLIYINKQKIRRKRLFFDNYYLHCRDVFVKDNLVIKIDFYDKDSSVSDRYSSNTENQSMLEVENWKRMTGEQRRFFARPIAHGRFKEDGNWVHWVVQNLYHKDENKRLFEHKNYGEFVRICEKLGLDDCCDNERNTFVDISGRLICIDYAM